jgi:hypothetical protein
MGLTSYILNQAVAGTSSRSKAKHLHVIATDKGLDTIRKGARTVR